MLPTAILGRDVWKFEHWDTGLTVPPDHVQRDKLGIQYIWEIGNKVITVDNYTKGWHIWSSLPRTVKDLRPVGRFEWDSRKIQDAVFEIANKIRQTYKRKKRYNPSMSKSKSQIVVVYNFSGKLTNAVRIGGRFTSRRAAIEKAFDLRFGSGAKGVWFYNPHTGKYTKYNPGSVSTKKRKELKKLAKDLKGYRTTRKYPRKISKLSKKIKRLSTPCKKRRSKRKY